jgi:predicted metalloprotease
VHDVGWAVSVGAEAGAGSGLLLVMLILMLILVVVVLMGGKDRIRIKGGLAGSGKYFKKGQKKGNNNKS